VAAVAQFVDDVGADEAGTACDQDAHVLDLLLGPVVERRA
jgi:hypothetical protein